MNSDPPHILFRNMIAALLALFLVGMGLLFHYMMMEDSGAMFFWWTMVAGGVPTGIWIIKENMRSKMTGARIPMHVLISPVVGVWLANAVAAIATVFFYA